MLQQEVQIGREVKSKPHDGNGTDAAFAELESVYVALVERANDGIIILRDGVLTFVNSRFATMVGHDVGDLVGKDFAEILTPASGAVVRQRYEARIAGEDVPGIYEIELFTRDGRIVPLEANAAAIEGQGQRAEMVILRDITRHKQAEEALRESKEKHRTLTENLNVGVYRNIPGANGKFVEVNPAIVKMHGYDSKEEFLATNVVDLYQNPEDRKNFNEKMLRDGFVRNEELHLRKKDGTPYIGSVSAVVVKDEKGDVKYYDGIVEDITERRRMQLEVEERQEYLASVLRNAPDAIVTIDAASCILQWNPAAEQLFGYTYDEVVGKDIDDVVTRPEIKKQATLLSKQVLSRESVPPTEVVRYRQDGTPVNVIAAGSPIIIEQEMRGAVVVYTDITERKRLEEELRDTVEKLKASHEELSTPVVQIWDRVLALPLIGVMDSHRAQNTMETLLRRIIETQSEIVILDITGVSSIDTQVVNHVIKTIQAAKLLGAECVISGIRPEIAQTMIQLGLNMESFPTRRNLRDGLMYALGKLGYGVAAGERK